MSFTWSGGIGEHGAIGGEKESRRNATRRRNAATIWLLPSPMKKEIGADKGGVGGTLEWLKARELSVRTDIDKASGQMAELRTQRDKGHASDDGGEWDKEMRVLQSDLDYLDKVHEKYRTDLLKFELKVVPEKRDAGESIKQLEGERVCEMAARHFRLGVEGMQLYVAQNWPLCKTEVDAFTVLKNALTPMMETAFENALEGQSLPKWVADSFRNGL